jgi:hypothetical protein
MPEPYDARVSRTVLRGGGAVNGASLPGQQTGRAFRFCGLQRLSRPPCCGTTDCRLPVLLTIPFHGDELRQAV